jgi:hypothetical protein
VQSSSGPLLAVIGDSLAVGTEAPLRAALPGWRVTSDGRVSRPLAEGMELLAQTPLPDEPLALAFSLFTNDDPWNVDALEAAVRESVARLPAGSCAIWATIVRPKVAEVSSAAAHRRLRELALDPLLAPSLRIADWAAAVRGHRRWISRDRVHATAAGYAERARLYADAAGTCPIAP